MLQNFRIILQCVNVLAFVLTEMYCNVHGPVYGCLEHCIPNIQLQITEGKSSHVNIPVVTLPFFRLLLTLRRSSVCRWRPRAVHQCVLKSHSSRTPSTSVIIPHGQAKKAQPVDSSHNNVFCGHFSFCSEEQFSNKRMIFCVFML